MAILLPQRFAVSLTHGDAWSCPGSGGEQRISNALSPSPPLRPAGRHDPEEWHRLLDRLFRILAGGVHRYEGTINQYTGDGIMALFGAPIAHEDHAQRACAAALDLARELGALAEDVRRESGLEFAVRMGLNSGADVVGRIG